MTKPITPNQIASAKLASIPDAVIEAFNEVIAAHYHNGYASFKQSEVVALIVAKGFSESEVFSNHWLDVEPIFEKAGWEVSYDSPGFNETYAATFKFRSKK